MSDFLELGLDATYAQKTSDDWYTPPWVFEGLGVTFDLDVCAPIGGLPWVPAQRSLSILDDGLLQEWTGRVWMNPPYSEPLPWVNKFITHNNGICLTPTSQGKWMLEVWASQAGWLMLPPMRFVFADLTIAKNTLPNRCWLIAMGEENIETLRSSGLGYVR